MKLKRFFAAALAGTFLALSLTACGGNTNADTNTDASNDTAASTGETTTVKLGVVGSIYEDLWAPAKEALKEEGIDLEIVVLRLRHPQQRPGQRRDRLERLPASHLSPERG